MYVSFVFDGSLRFSVGTIMMLESCLSVSKKLFSTVPDGGSWVNDVGMLIVVGQVLVFAH